MADSTLSVGEGKQHPATVGQISEAVYGDQFADLKPWQQKKALNTTYWHNNPEAARASNEAQWAPITTLLKTLVSYGDVKGCVGGDGSSCAWLASGLIPGKKLVDGFQGAGKAIGKLDGLGSTAARACSFSGETRVLMADGSTQPISQVEVGDKVIATDPETGELVAREVTRVWVHEDTVVDLKFEGATITTTPDHRFYNATDEQFQRADALDPGDEVRTDDGRTLTVIGLQPDSKRRALAYNLTVRGIHTYHVGYTNILVHNDCRVDVGGGAVERNTCSSH